MSAFALLPIWLWIFLCIMPRSMGSVFPSGNPSPGKTYRLPLYSAVMVFGDSYSDDGHRETEPVENPYKSMPEKYRNIMWPTFLMETLARTGTHALYDYAYNGAMASNDMTHYGSKHVPDTRDQMKEFAAQLEKGEISLGNDQSLVIFWIGINPLTVIFIEAFSPQATGGNGLQAYHDPALVAALERVDKQVIELKSQLDHMHSDVFSKNKNATHYMIINVPHQELTPSVRRRATSWSNGNVTLMNEYLNLMNILVERYNTGLRGFLASANVNKRSNGGDYEAGVPRLCDVVPIWDKILKGGSHYGLTNTTGPCFENNVVCADPDTYAFWDYSHPMPKVEKILADEFYNCIYMFEQ